MRIERRVFGRLVEVRRNVQAQRDKDSIDKYGVKWRTTRSGHVIGISPDGKLVKINPHVRDAIAKKSGGGDGGGSKGGAHAHADKLRSALKGLPGVTVNVGKGMAGDKIEVTKKGKNGETELHLVIQSTSKAHSWGGDKEPPKVKASAWMGARAGAYGNAHSGSLDKVLAAVAKRMKSKFGG